MECISHFPGVIHHLFPPFPSSADHRIHGLVHMSRGETSDDAVTGVILSKSDPVRTRVADRRDALCFEDDFILLAPDNGNQIHEVHHRSWTVYHGLAGLHRIHIVHRMDHLLQHGRSHHVCIREESLTKKPMTKFTLIR